MKFGKLIIMKVNLASLGRYHTFDLAQQLGKHGILNRLYTAYPKYKVNRIDPQKISTYPWLNTPLMVFGKLSLYSLQNALNYPAILSFDHWLSSHVEEADIFHCMSSFGTHAMQEAKKRFGSVTICDRGSTHILFQNEILAEEYARWGISYQPIDPRIIERELQEYRECDFITVPSEFVTSSFIKKGVLKEKLLRIPYGVDLTLFQPLPKADRVFRVIYAGSLSIRKGLPYILEAIASIQLPHFEFWLIGGITKEIKPFLSHYRECFRYMGFIPRNQLSHYYSQGSVFIIASLEEGLALVQAQAMACGLPLISTPNTGCEDLIEDGKQGYVVPIRDAQAIREKIIFLYQNPENRDQMSQLALQHVNQIGGWDTYGDQMVYSYSRILNLDHRN